MRCSGSDRPILVTMRGNARGAKGVGHSRWDRRVNGQPEEPAGVGGRRQPSLSGTSRVTGDGQARFCEGLEVKLLGSTRQRWSQSSRQYLEQVRNRETNESEPFEDASLKYSNVVETGGVGRLRDKSVGCLMTGQTATGVERA
jgi:hypothetical protein